MAQSHTEPVAVHPSTLPESKQENLRRYGYLILDAVWEKYQRKTANGAIVSTVSTSASEIATAIHVPKQVAGRALTALVRLSPDVCRASRSYAFDVDRIDELREAMKRIQDLQTREAESAAISAIVSLCGPVTGREIQRHLSSWLGYELSIGQVNARINDVNDLAVLPGNGGYLSSTVVDSSESHEESSIERDLYQNS